MAAESFGWAEGRENEGCGERFGGGEELDREVFLGLGAVRTASNVS